MATPDAAVPARGLTDPYGVAPLDEAAVAAEAAHVGFLVLDYLVALLARQCTRRSHAQPTGAEAFSGPGCLWTCSLAECELLPDRDLRGPACQSGLPAFTADAGQYSNQTCKPDLRHTQSGAMP